ncbi:retention module-containing protein, partial [Sulfurospirillum oryzae]|uniref:retention module-containing protein n=1 Tax=Sulfurospirillum oryzae TaxID=2976535 RepID=UPI0021E8249A
MALSIGTIKNLTGLVMVKSAQGEEKVLKVGDPIHFEDSIRTIGAGSNVLLVLADGQEITVNGNDDIFLDKSVYVAERFGEEAVVAGTTMENVVAGKSVEDIQAALLAGKDINALEAPAAGEGGTIGTGMTTNAMARYLSGGSESNVTADYRTVGSSGSGDVSYTPPTATVATATFPTNDAPLASNMEIKIDEDKTITSLLPAATDANGDTVTYTLGAGATNGSVVVNTDGSYTYTPNANYNGSDGFTYTISDGKGGENTYSVAITVNPINDPAILSSASVGLEETNAVLTTAGALSVTDVDEGEAAYVAQSSVAGTYGTFSIASDGTWTYTANESYDSLNAGDKISDTFNVASIDGTPSSVTVTITGTNDTAILSSASVGLEETNAVLTTAGALSVTDVDEGEAAYV